MTAFINFNYYLIFSKGILTSNDKNYLFFLVAPVINVIFSAELIQFEKKKKKKPILHHSDE